jgi:hypothetical protein
MGELVWAGVVVLLWWRMEPLLSRLVAVAEQRAHPRPLPSDPEGIALPPDLESMALEYDEEWARDQTRMAMREEYGKVGNWDIVRQKFIGRTGSDA